MVTAGRKMDEVASCRFWLRYYVLSASVHFVSDMIEFVQNLVRAARRRPRARMDSTVAHPTSFSYRLPPKAGYLLRERAYCGQRSGTVVEIWHSCYLSRPGPFRTPETSKYLESDALFPVSAKANLWEDACASSGWRCGAQMNLTRTFSHHNCSEAIHECDAAGST
jgi:hypothetical protein